MSYVNKKERIFRYGEPLDIPHSRSEARMKKYWSATDRRAWCDEVELRRQHILELNARNKGHANLKKEKRKLAAAEKSSSGERRSRKRKGDKKPEDIKQRTSSEKKYRPSVDKQGRQKSEPRAFGSTTELDSRIPPQKSLKKRSRISDAGDDAKRAKKPKTKRESESSSIGEPSKPKSAEKQDVAIRAKGRGRRQPGDDKYGQSKQSKADQKKDENVPGEYSDKPSKPGERPAAGKRSTGRPSEDKQYSKGQTTPSGTTKGKEGRSAGDSGASTPRGPRERKTGKEDKKDKLAGGVKDKVREEEVLPHKDRSTPSDSTKAKQKGPKDTEGALKSMEPKKRGDGEDIKRGKPVGELKDKVGVKTPDTGRSTPSDAAKSREGRPGDSPRLKSTGPNERETDDEENKDKSAKRAKNQVGVGAADKGRGTPSDATKVKKGHPGDSEASEPKGPKYRGTGEEGRQTAEGAKGKGRAEVSPDKGQSTPPDSTKVKKGHPGDSEASESKGPKDRGTGEEGTPVERAKDKTRTELSPDKGQGTASDSTKVKKGHPGDPEASESKGPKKQGTGEDGRPVERTKDKARTELSPDKGQGTSSDSTKVKKGHPGDSEASESKGQKKRGTGEEGRPVERTKDKARTELSPDKGQGTPDSTKVKKGHPGDSEASESKGPKDRGTGEAGRPVERAKDKTRTELSPDKGAPSDATKIKSGHPGDSKASEPKGPKDQGMGEEGRQPAEVAKRKARADVSPDKGQGTPSDATKSKISRSRDTDASGPTGLKARGTGEEGRKPTEGAKDKTRTGVSPDKDQGSSSDATKGKKGYPGDSETLEPRGPKERGIGDEGRKPTEGAKDKAKSGVSPDKDQATSSDGTKGKKGYPGDSKAMAPSGPKERGLGEEGRKPTEGAKDKAKSGVSPDKDQGTTSDATKGKKGHPGDFEPLQSKGPKERGTGEEGKKPTEGTKDKARSGVSPDKGRGAPSDTIKGKESRPEYSEALKPTGPKESGVGEDGKKDRPVGGVKDKTGIVAADKDRGTPSDTRKDKGGRPGDYEASTLTGSKEKGGKDEDGKKDKPAGAVPDRVGFGAADKDRGTPSDTTKDKGRRPGDHEASTLIGPKGKKRDEDGKKDKPAESVRDRIGFGAPEDRGVPSDATKDKGGRSEELKPTGPNEIEKDVEGKKSKTARGMRDKLEVADKDRGAPSEKAKGKEGRPGDYESSRSTGPKQKEIDGDGIKDKPTDRILAHKVGVEAANKDRAAPSDTTKDKEEYESSRPTKEKRMDDYSKKDKPAGGVRDKGGVGSAKKDTGEPSDTSKDKRGRPGEYEASKPTGTARDVRDRVVVEADKDHGAPYDTKKDKEGRPGDYEATKSTEPKGKGKDDDGKKDKLAGGVKDKVGVGAADKDQEPHDPEKRTKGRGRPDRADTEKPGVSESGVTDQDQVRDKEKADRDRPGDAETKTLHDPEKRPKGRGRTDDRKIGRADKTVGEKGQDKDRPVDEPSRTAVLDEKAQIDKEVGLVRGSGRGKPVSDHAPEERDRTTPTGADDVDKPWDKRIVDKVKGSKPDIGDREKDKKGDGPEDIGQPVRGRGRGRAVPDSEKPGKQDDAFDKEVKPVSDKDSKRDVGDKYKKGVPVDDKDGGPYSHDGQKRTKGRGRGDREKTVDAVKPGEIEEGVKDQEKGGKTEPSDSDKREPTKDIHEKLTKTTLEKKGEGRGIPSGPTAISDKAAPEDTKGGKQPGAPDTSDILAKAYKVDDKHGPRVKRDVGKPPAKISMYDMGHQVDSSKKDPETTVGKELVSDKDAAGAKEDGGKEPFKKSVPSKIGTPGRAGEAKDIGRTIKQEFEDDSLTKKDVLQSDSMDECGSVCDEIEKEIKARQQKIGKEIPADKKQGVREGTIPGKEGEKPAEKKAGVKEGEIPGKERDKRREKPATDDERQAKYGPLDRDRAKPSTLATETGRSDVAQAEPGSQMDKELKAKDKRRELPATDDERQAKYVPLDRGRAKPSTLATETGRTDGAEAEPGSQMDKEMKTKDKIRGIPAADDERQAKYMPLDRETDKPSTLATKTGRSDVTQAEPGSEMDKELKTKGPLQKYAKDTESTSVSPSILQPGYTESGPPSDKYGKPVAGGMPIDQKPTDQYGRVIDMYGRPIDQSGRPMVHSGIPKVQDGKPTDQDRRPTNQDGRSIDLYGKPIYDTDVEPIDQGGRIIGPGKGPIVHEERLTDQNGRLIDKDVQPIVQDGSPRDQVGISIDQEERSIPDGRPIHQYGRPIDRYERPIDQDERRFDKDGSPIGQDGIPIVQDGKSTVQDRRPMDQVGIPIDGIPKDRDKTTIVHEGRPTDLDQFGKPIDQYGRQIDKDGRPRSQDERLISQDGRPIVQDGRSMDQVDIPIDRDEIPIIQDERPIDQYGKLIDKKGRLVGSPIVQDKIPIDRVDIPIDQDDRSKVREGRPIDQYSIPIDQYEKTIDKEGRPIGQDGRSIVQNGKPKDLVGIPIDQDGRPIGRDKRPIGQDGRPTDLDGTLVDQYGRQTDQYIRPIAKDGRRISQANIPTVEDGRPMDQVGVPIYQDEILIDQDGRPIDKYERPIDKDGRPIGQAERPTVQDGRPTDQVGVPIYQDGILIDQDGEMIDQYGRPIDKDGRPISQLGRPIPIDKDQSPIGQYRSPTVQEGRPRDQVGLPLDQDGILIDQDGEMIDQYGRPIDKDGRPISHLGRPMPIDKDQSPIGQYRRPTVQEGRPRDQVGLPLDQDGILIDHDGRSIDQYERPIDKDGRPIGHSERPRVPDGRPRDQVGVPDQDGILIDHDGEPIDQYGRPIDKDGIIMDKLPLDQDEWLKADLDKPGQILDELEKFPGEEGNIELDKIRHPGTKMEPDTLSSESVDITRSREYGLTPKHDDDLRITESKIMPGDGSLGFPGIPGNGKEPSCKSKCSSHPVGTQYPMPSKLSAESNENIYKTPSRPGTKINAEFLPEFQMGLLEPTKSKSEGEDKNILRDGDEIEEMDLLSTMEASGQITIEIESPKLSREEFDTATSKEYGLNKDDLKITESKILTAGGPGLPDKETKYPCKSKCKSTGQKYPIDRKPLGQVGTLLEPTKSKSEGEDKKILRDADEIQEMDLLSTMEASGQITIEIESPKLSSEEFDTATSKEYGLPYKDDLKLTESKILTAGGLGLPDKETKYPCKSKCKSTGQKYPIDRKPLGQVGTLLEPTKSKSEGEDKKILRDGDEIQEMDLLSTMEASGQMQIEIESPKLSSEEFDIATSKEYDLKITESKILTAGGPGLPDKETKYPCKAKCKSTGQKYPIERKPLGQVGTEVNIHKLPVEPKKSELYTEPLSIIQQDLPQSTVATNEGEENRAGDETQYLKMESLKQGPDQQASEVIGRSLEICETKLSLVKRKIPEKELFLSVFDLDMPAIESSNKGQQVPEIEVGEIEKNTKISKIDPKAVPLKISKIESHIEGLKNYTEESLGSTPRLEGLSVGTQDDNFYSALSKDEATETRKPDHKCMAPCRNARERPTVFGEETGGIVIGSDLEIPHDLIPPGYYMPDDLSPRAMPIWANVPESAPVLPDNISLSDSDSQSITETDKAIWIVHRPNEEILEVFEDRSISKLVSDWETNTEDVAGKYSEDSPIPENIRMGHIMSRVLSGQIVGLPSTSPLLKRTSPQTLTQAIYQRKLTDKVCKALCAQANIVKDPDDEERVETNEEVSDINTDTEMADEVYESGISITPTQELITPQFENNTPKQDTGSSKEIQSYISSEAHHQNLLVSNIVSIDEQEAVHTVISEELLIKTQNISGDPKASESDVKMPAVVDSTKQDIYIDATTKNPHLDSQNSKITLDRQTHETTVAEEISKNSLNEQAFKPSLDKDNISQEILPQEEMEQYASVIGNMQGGSENELLIANTIELTGSEIVISTSRPNEFNTVEDFTADPKVKAINTEKSGEIADKPTVLVDSDQQTTTNTRTISSQAISYSDHIVTIEEDIYDTPLVEFPQDVYDKLTNKILVPTEPNECITEQDTKVIDEWQRDDEYIDAPLLLLESSAHNNYEYLIDGGQQTTTCARTISVEAVTHSKHMETVTESRNIGNEYVDAIESWPLPQQYDAPPRFATWFAPPKVEVRKPIGLTAPSETNIGTSVCKSTCRMSPQSRASKPCKYKCGSLDVTGNISLQPPVQNITTEANPLNKAPTDEENVEESDIMQHICKPTCRMSHGNRSKPCPYKCGAIHTAKDDTCHVSPKRENQDFNKSDNQSPKLDPTSKNVPVYEILDRKTLDMGKTKLFKADKTCQAYENVSLGVMTNEIKTTIATKTVKKPDALSPPTKEALNLDSSIATCHASCATGQITRSVHQLQKTISFNTDENVRDVEEEPGSSSTAPTPTDVVKLEELLKRLMMPPKQSCRGACATASLSMDDEIQLLRGELNAKDAHCAEQKKIAAAALEQLENIKNIVEERDDLRKKLQNSQGELAELKKNIDLGFGDVETPERKKSDIYVPFRDESETSVTNSCDEEIQNLEDEIKKMRNFNSLSPDQEAKVIKKEVEVLKRYCAKLSSIQKENVCLKKTNYELNNRCLESEDKIKALGLKDDDQFLEIKEKLSSLSDTVAERDALQNRVKHLEKELNEYRDLPEDIEMFKRRSILLDDVLKDRDRLAKRVEQMRGMDEELRLMKQKAERVDDLERQLRLATKDVQAAEDELDSTRNKCTMAEIEMLNQKTEADTLRSRCVCMEHEMESLKCVCKEQELLQIEKDRLQVSLDELVRMQDDYEHMCVQMKALDVVKAERDRYKRKYDDLVRVESECNILREQLDKAKGIEIEKNMLENQTEDLEKCICEQEDEIRRLVTHIDCLAQGKEEQQIKMKEVVSNLKIELEKKDSLLMLSEEKMATIHGKIDTSIHNFSEETVTQRKKQQILEEKNKDIERENKNLYQKNQNLQKNIETLNNENAALKDKLHENIKENKFLQRQLESQDRAICTMQEVLTDRESYGPDNDSSSCNAEVIARLQNELDNAKAENLRLQTLTLQEACSNSTSETNYQLKNMLEQSKHAIERIALELEQQYAEWDGGKRYKCCPGCKCKEKVRQPEPKVIIKCCANCTCKKIKTPAPENSKCSKNENPSPNTRQNVGQQYPDGTRKDIIKCDNYTCIETKTREPETAQHVEEHNPEKQSNTKYIFNIANKATDPMSCKICKCVGNQLHVKNQRVETESTSKKYKNIGDMPWSILPVPSDSDEDADDDQMYSARSTDENKVRIAELENELSITKKTIFELKDKLGTNERLLEENSALRRHSTEVQEVAKDHIKDLVNQIKNATHKIDQLKSKNCKLKYEWAKAQQQLADRGIVRDTLFSSGSEHQVHVYGARDSHTIELNSKPHYAQENTDQIKDLTDSSLLARLQSELEECLNEREKLLNFIETLKQQLVGVQEGSDLPDLTVYAQLKTDLAECLKEKEKLLAEIEKLKKTVQVYAESSDAELLSKIKSDLEACLRERENLLKMINDLSSGKSDDLDLEAFVKLKSELEHCLKEKETLIKTVNDLQTNNENLQREQDQLNKKMTNMITTSERGSKQVEETPDYAKKTAKADAPNMEAIYLKTELDKCLEEKEQLLKTINDLKTNNDNLKKEKDELDRMLMSKTVTTSRRSSKLENQIDAFGPQNTIIIADNEKLKEKLKNNQDEIDKLKAEIAKYKDKEQNKQVEETSNDEQKNAKSDSINVEAISNLKAELEKCLKEKEALLKTINDLRTNNENLMKEKDDLDKMLLGNVVTTSRRSSKLEHEIDAFGPQNKILIADNNKLNEKLKNNQDEIDNLKAEIAKYKEENKKSNKQVEETSNDVQKTAKSESLNLEAISNLKAELEKCLEEKEALLKTINDLRTNNDHLKKEKDDLDKMLMSNVGTTSRRSSKLENELDAFGRQNKILIADNDKLNEKLKNYQDEIDMLKAEIAKHKDDKQPKKQVEETSNDLQKTYKSDSPNVEALSNLKAKLEKCLEEKEALLKTINDLKINNDNLKKEKDDLDKMLMSNVVTTSRRSSKLENELDAFGRQNKILIADNDKLNEKLKNNQNDIDKLMAEIAKYKDENKQPKKQLKEISDDAISNLKAELEKCLREKESLLKTINDLKINNENLKKAKDDLNIMLMSNVKTTSRKSSKLGNELDAAGSQNKILISDNEKLNKTLKQNQDEIDKLMDEISRYKDENKQLKKHIEDQKQEIQSLLGKLSTITGPLDKSALEKGKKDKDSTQSTINDLEKQLQNLMAKDKIKAIEPTDEFKQKIIELMKELEEAQKRAETAEDTLRKLKSSDPRPMMMADIQKLKDRIAQLENENTTLNHGLSQANIDKANLKKDLNNAINDAKKVQDENIALRKSAADLKVDKDNITKSMQKLSTDLSDSSILKDANNKLNKKNAELEQDVLTLKNELKQINAEAKNSADRVNQLMSENSDLKKTLVQIEGENSKLKRDLESALSDTKKTADKLFELEKDNAKRKQTIKDLEAEVARLKRELDNLLNEAKKGADIVSNLQKEIAELKQRMAQIESINAKLDDENTKVKKELEQARGGSHVVASLQDEYNKIKKQNIGLQSEIDKLQKELENVLADTNSKDSTISKLQDNVNNLKKNLQLLETENTELKNKLAKMSSDSKMDDLQTKYNKLRQNLAEIENENLKLKKDLQKALDDSKKVNEDIELLRQNEKKCKDKITQLERDNDKLNKEFNTTLDEFNKMGTEVSGIQESESKLKQRILLFETENSKLKKDLDAALENFRKAAGEASLLKDENAKLKQRIAQLESENAKLKLEFDSTIIELKKAEDQIKQIQDDNNKYKQKNRDMENDTKILKQKLDTFKGAKPDDNVKKLLEDELNKLKKELEITKKDVKKNGQENTELKDENNLLQKIKQLETEISKLKKDLEIGSKATKSAEAELLELQNAHANLKGQLAQLKDNNNKLQKENAALTDDAKKAATDLGKLTELKNNENKLKQRIAQLEAENAKLKKDLDEALSDAKSLEDELTSRKKENTNLKQQLLKREGDNNKLKNDLDTAKSEAERGSFGVNDLKVVDDKLKHKIAQLETENSTLKTELAKAFDDVKKYMTNLTKLQDEDDKLKQKLAQLESQNSKLKKDLDRATRDAKSGTDGTAELRSEISKLKQKVSLLESEIATLKKQLDASLNDAKNITADLFKSEDEIKKLKQMISQLEKENKRPKIDQLPQSKSEIASTKFVDDDGLKSKLKQGEMENSNLKTEIQKLNDKIKQLEGEINKLKAALISATKSAPEPADGSKDISKKDILKLPDVQNLLEEIQKLNKTINILEQELAKLKKHNTTLEEENGKLEIDLKNKKDALNNAMKGVDANQYDIVITDYENQIKALEAQLEKQKKECQDTISSLKAQFDRDMRNLLKKNEENIDKLQDVHSGEVKSLRNSINKIQQESDTTVREKERLKNLLDDQKKKSIGIKSKVEDVEKVILKERRRSKELEKQHSKLQSVTSVLEQEIIKEKRQSLHIQKERDDLEDKLQHLKKEREALKRESEIIQKPLDEKKSIQSLKEPKLRDEKLTMTTFETVSLAPNVIPISVPLSENELAFYGKKLWPCPCSMDDLLKKLAKKGFPSLSMEELQLIHRHVSDASANILEKMGQKTGVLQPTDCRDRLSLLRRIAALEDNLMRKQKQTQEKIAEMQNAVKIEKDRLTQLRNNLERERTSYSSLTSEEPRKQLTKDAESLEKTKLQLEKRLNEELLNKLRLTKQLLRPEMNLKVTNIPRQTKSPTRKLSSHARHSTGKL